MSLCVGDIGTIIELDITEPDSNGVQQPTTFIPGTDTVNFVFNFSNGAKLSKAGTFASGSKARYTTVSGDIPDGADGLCDVQLQITSAAWTGCTDPPFVIDIGKKLPTS